MMMTYIISNISYGEDPFDWTSRLERFAIISFTKFLARVSGDFVNKFFVVSSNLGLLFFWALPL